MDRNIGWASREAQKRESTAASAAVMHRYEKEGFALGNAYLSLFRKPLSTVEKCLEWERLEGFGKCFVFIDCLKCGWLLYFGGV